MSTSSVSSHSAASRTDLASSEFTIRSDSENYSSADSLPQSPESSSSRPLTLYSPPTVWGLLRGAAINLFLPFVNGLMLGFGELLAHEVAFRLGWSGTKVSPKLSLEGVTLFAFPLSTTDPRTDFSEWSLIQTYGTRYRDSRRSPGKKAERG